MPLVPTQAPGILPGDEVSADEEFIYRRGVGKVDRRHDKIELRPHPAAPPPRARRADQVRHSSSFLRIHPRSSSPSDGSQPEPVNKYAAN